MKVITSAIRYMGERVAAVVADTVDHAEEACRKNYLRNHKQSK